MITGTALILTDGQVNSMASSLGTWFSSILNLLVDFRHVILALFVFWIIIRFFRKKDREYMNTGNNNESRAVSGTGNKYGSTGGKAKSSGSIKNRFGFK